MPNHLSSIGLPVSSVEDFVALAEQVLELCEEFPVKKGSYLRWSSRCGAELWLQVNRRKQVIGMNPHFAGESAVRVGLTKRITRPGATALDGAFHGWAEPQQQDPESGDYPFVFDCPDFLCHDGLPLPRVIRAQVAAFAHEATAYPSEEAFAAGQGGELRMAPQSFIPSGLFSPGGGSTDPPQAHAIFTGHVKRAERRTNELTGEAFFWALVETYGGVYDAVIDSALLDQVPPAGGVITGSFWLSGRLLT